MKKKQERALLYALSLIFLQLLALITSRSSGLAFMASVLAITAYEIYQETINIKEVAVGVLTFVLSGLVSSYISKKLVYDDLCELSDTLSGMGSEPTIPGQDACMSVLEVFIENITASPIRGWFFWIPTLIISAAAMYSYRNYR